jgi:hypothetical protein
MSNLQSRISDHQEWQAFRWEVIELLDTAQQHWRTVDKTRDVLKCLLTESEHWSTDEFWKHKVLEHTHWIVTGW